MISASLLPSIPQAKLIARIWSDFRPTRNVMTYGRDGGVAYVDPTTTACIKRGWLAPTGALEFHENGCTYLPHGITDAGFLALENFLMDMRINLRTALSKAEPSA